MIHRILAKALSRARIRATIGAVDADEGVERPAPGAAPTAFRIWRAGENPTSKGMTVFTRRSAELLAADQAVRGTLYSIDVDHMSLSDVAPPEHHRAVGWHRLEVRQSNAGPELWAVDVEWTSEVKAALESKPPGFRYFSPAYDVARETGEVVGYLNTALTNNPATYQVTALATRAGAEEEKPMKMEDILAALKAGAEGDDEAKAKKCKAALAALTASEGDEEMKPDEEKKDSEGDDDKDEKKDTDDEEKKGDDDKKKEDTKASVAAALDVATVLKLVDRRLQSVRDESERERLIASRKDLNDKQVAYLKKQSLASVREYLDATPIAAKRNPAADTDIRATRGEGQGEGGASQLDPKVKSELDARMGLTTRKDCIVHHKTKTSFHAMTAEQARRVLASKGGK